jgi:hypothetical protein
MSIFNKLQYSPVENQSEEDIKLPSKKNDENFDLHEQISESDLDDFWNNVEQDIQQDPEWFKFTE